MGRKLQSLVTLCLLTAICCLMLQAQAAEVLAAHPPDADLFAQGMELVDGRLIFSSGLYEPSKVRAVDLENGQLKAVQKLPDHVFAEGLTATPAGIWLISWQEGEARLLTHIAWRKSIWSSMRERAGAFAMTASSSLCQTAAPGSPYGTPTPLRKKTASRC